MKSLSLRTIVLVAGTLFAFTSCEIESVAPEQGLEPSLSTARSASGAVVTHESFRIDLAQAAWYQSNFCAGEEFTVTEGILNVVITTVQNGNKYNYQIHNNTSNYRLVGNSTGTEYTGNYTDNASQSLTLAGYPFIYTSTVKVRLAAPGKGNNPYYLYDFHMTINAQGEPTSTVGNFRVGCQ